MRLSMITRAAPAPLADGERRNDHIGRSAVVLERRGGSPFLDGETERKRRHQRE